MISPPQIPRATYRLQLNRDFTFAQATAIVPYLAGLGISHCYISPCLKARPGSMHGYDIVDHNCLNPEIGSAEELDRFVAALRQHGMGLILDIVPNHMAVMGSDNAWWLDVLENGEASTYACFFDIHWHPMKDELDGKVLVPVLHDHYGAVLENGELKLAFHPERGEFDITYQSHRFPIDPKAYPFILQPCPGTIAAQLGEQNPDSLEFESLITSFRNLPGREEVLSQRIAERNRDKEIHKRRLAELCARAPEITSCIRARTRTINGVSNDVASFEQLHELIKAQAYRLASWRVASDDVNYRRFVDSNDLAGICGENDAVFQATHRLILNLLAEEKVDGLRIDHPDGLYDPAQYFERLRSSMGQAVQRSRNAERAPNYMVIEKILTGSEHLPANWPVSGTTGYDFATLLNGLFVDPAASKSMEGIYRNFTGEEADFDALAYECRKLIVRVALASEVNVLANQLTRIALSKRHTCDFTLNSLRDALTEVVASFPVYRTYVSSSGISEKDADYIRGAVALAKRRSQAADTSVFDFLREILLVRIAEGQDSAYRNAVITFVMKFQQFSSPVMAKGLEDTAFYRYHRLISLNEVGSDLHRFGTSVPEFHAANQQRLLAWPHTMLATSTHDSKRSGDVRARINVLSEIPGLWRFRVHEWRRLNRNHKRRVNDRAAPSLNDEYFLYQTLLGAWPSEMEWEPNQWLTFCQRIESYMIKAIREAKQNTSWINRNPDYEDAMSSFVKALLNRAPGNKFLNDFVPFQQRIARLGAWNSLSQTLLKLTCPGVPDIYQGTELWNFSLVDPDNRRPIDYALPQDLLAQVRGWYSAADQESVEQFLENPGKPELKLYMIWRTLCLRKHFCELFQGGDYLALAVQGAKSNHVVAFLRTCETAQLLVIVPRLLAGLLEDSDMPPTGEKIWQDTHVLLPPSRRAEKYRNAFTGVEIFPEKADAPEKIGMSELLAHFPVGLYVAS
jgi:(1->4)-alpha-D-glucan 1-alpha-D-glucosylmutase